jgi:hypothetical protein
MAAMVAMVAAALCVQAVAVSNAAGKILRLSRSQMSMRGCELTTSKLGDGGWDIIDIDTEGAAAGRGERARKIPFRPAPTPPLFPPPSPLYGKDGRERLSMEDMEERGSLWKRWKREALNGRDESERLSIPAGGIAALCRHWQARAPTPRVGSLPSSSAAAGGSR